MVQAFVAGALIGAMVIGGAKLAAKDETRDVYTFADPAATVETKNAPEVTD